MSAFDSIPSATITADLGAGVVEQSATSWSIDRTLSGGGLPGQARAASGSSVGSGTVSVESDATPWNAGAIKPAGRVTVSASEDVGAAASRVGTMVVRSVGAPSALSSERDLSIEDDLGGLRGQVTMPTVLGAYLDWRGTTKVLGIEAAWAIDQAARAGGYYATPPPVASCIFSLPLTGSPVPEVGKASIAADADKWIEVDGRTLGAYQSTMAGTTTTGTFPSHFYVTFDRTGPSSFPVGIGDFLQGPSVSGSFLNQAHSPYGATLIPGGTSDDEAITRVQVEIALTGLTETTFSGMSMRARVKGGAWSSWLTNTFSPAVGMYGGLVVAGHDTRNAAGGGIQVHTEDDPAVWSDATARIAPTGSQLSAVVTPRTASSWSLIQEVAAATLGAVWIDEDGVLTYRNREQLRGSGTPAETVYSLDSLDDVPWEVSTDDVADRVEVSYNPPIITQVTDYSATVWQSTEVVTIRAGQSIVIEQDIDGAADDLAPWYPAWNTTVAPVTRYSRWAASTLPGGGGPQPADNALDITAEMVNPSKVRIRIRNTTTGTLYTAGTDGTTLLTLRANVVARPSEPLTLSTGLPADKAIAPLSIDLGSWVQDQDTAQEILSWLTGTLSQPLPILRQVGVTPKASRRLGDVIVLRDPYTELASKALITGIHSSGEAGRYSQSLDLAILSTTFDDMDRWSVANGITTFDQLDAFLIANGIDTFDKWDAYTARIGGNL